MSAHSMVRLEAGRAFSGWRFLGALAVGLALVVWHQLSDVYPVSSQETMAAFPDLNYPFSLYERWIGYRLWSSSGFAFLLLTPLLATIPHGVSRQLDARSGYDIQLLVRTSQANYLAARCMATFFAGVVVIAIPMMVDFVATAAQLPALSPITVTATFPIGDQSMWAHLYYERPLAYSIIYGVIYCMWAGLIATTTVFTARRMSPILAIAIPFLVFWTIDFAFALIDAYIPMVHLSPLTFMRPDQPLQNNSLLVVAGEWVGVAAAVIIWLRHRAAHDEQL